MKKAEMDAEKDINPILFSSVDKVSRILEKWLASPSSIHNKFLTEECEHYRIVAGDDGTDSFLRDISRSIIFSYKLSPGLLDDGNIDDRGFASLLKDVSIAAKLDESLAGIDADYFKDHIETIHESFLSFHEPRRKRERGVFYTPEPVISYIINFVNDLLASKFEIEDGLANERVACVDPACGTGAFLHAVLEHCKGTTPRNSSLFGIECMLSTYRVARARFENDNQNTGRIGLIYGNAFDVAHDMVGTLLSEHSDPVLVLVGNPPYSVSSANKFQFIENLMVDYKRNLTERNIQPLSDDYIKFIRLSQWMIEQAGKGIVAFITNNSFIYKIIHRVMRKHLLSTFDSIYIINLHGNANIGEKAPDGGPDENVFDIRVGTAIIFLVKKGLSEDNVVYFHEMYGRREQKLDFLAKNSLNSTRFELLGVKPPNYFMISRDTRYEEEYSGFMSLREIFSQFIIGVKTHRDDFIVEHSKEQLEVKLHHLVGNSTDQEIKDRYALKDGLKTIAKYRNDLRDQGILDKLFIPYIYRPFDKRILYYHKCIITRHRESVMRHVLAGVPTLVTTRLLSGPSFTHVLAVQDAGDIGLLSSRTSESAYFFPLYLKGENGTHRSNFTPKFLAFIRSHPVLKGVSAEEFFAYMYAVLHSSVYRRRYIEFLKIDFPRIPIPDDISVFTKLARLGQQMLDLHLRQEVPPVDFATTRQELVVSSPSYNADTHQVFFTEHDYLVVRPELWNFRIGNYPVLKKWLKGRKNMKFFSRDIDTFSRIVGIIDKTLDIMKLIDLIPFKTEG